MKDHQLHITIEKDKLLFEKSCEAHSEVFKERNEVHGSAFRETGVLGSVVEITAIASRLRNYVLRNSTHGRDKEAEILNACEDLHNYANFVRMMIQEQNWEGIE